MARSSIIITGEVLQLNTHGSLQVSQLGVVQWLQLHMLHSLVLKERERFRVEKVQDGGAPGPWRDYQAALD